MRHRHLNHEGWSLAAIDDVIARGKLDDWKALRDAATRDRSLGARILRICAAHTVDPYAQRYHFWEHYVRKQIA